MTQVRTSSGNVADAYPPNFCKRRLKFSHVYLETQPGNMKIVAWILASVRAAASQDVNSAVHHSNFQNSPTTRTPAAASSRSISAPFSWVIIPRARSVGHIHVIGRNVDCGLCWSDVLRLPG